MENSIYCIVRLVPWLMICTLATDSYGDASSQNQSLERHFDKLLAIEYPMLAHALSEIDATDTLFSTGEQNVVVSQKVEQFSSGPSQVHYVSGFMSRMRRLRQLS